LIIVRVLAEEELSALQDGKMARNAIPLLSSTRFDSSFAFTGRRMKQSLRFAY
jgi:hypothetical protein